MARNSVDFTLIFRRLCDAASSPDGDAGVRNLFTDPSSFDDWAARWRHRLVDEGGEGNERRTAMPKLHSSLSNIAAGTAIATGDADKLAGILQKWSNTPAIVAEMGTRDARCALHPPTSVGAVARVAQSIRARTTARRVDGDRPNRADRCNRRGGTTNKTACRRECCRRRRTSSDRTARRAAAAHL